MPLPVEDLGQVLAHLVDVLLVLDELVVYLLDEIRAAVAAGQRDPSPAARAFWQRFPRGDGEPTPEDVMLRLAEEARRRMNGGTS